MPPLLLFKFPPTRVNVPAPKLAPRTAPLATTLIKPEFRMVLTVVGAEALVPVFRIRAFEIAGEMESARLPVPCKAVLKKLLFPVPLMKATPSAPKLRAPWGALALKVVPKATPPAPF